MADIKIIEEQLKKIGCNFRFWGRAELRELANILLAVEQIHHCINGQYEGGFAMLCATDQRVLLIDKKPMYLTIEDIRFDMIAELDYNHRLVNSSLLICTPNKSLRFTAYNQHRLRQFYSFVQHRVMEIRQHYMQMAQEQQSAAMAPAPQFPQQAYSAPPAPPQPSPQFQPAAPAPSSEQQQAAAFSPYFTDQAQQAQPQPQLATVGPQPPQASGVAAMPRRVAAPIISAYTRLPLMSRQRRFLGSRAMNTPMPSIYQQQR